VSKLLDIFYRNQDPNKINSVMDLNPFFYPDPNFLYIFYLDTTLLVKKTTPDSVPDPTLNNQYFTMLTILKIFSWLIKAYRTFQSKSLTNLT
jgi:hypothetical protein